MGKDSSNGACSPLQGQESQSETLMVRFQQCLGFKCWLCFCAGQGLCGQGMAYGARIASLFCPLCGAGAGEGVFGAGMPE